MFKPIAAALTATALLSASAFAVNVQKELMVSLDKDGAITKTHQTKAKKKIAHKASRVVGDSYNDGGVIYTTIFEEDFSRFTEGTEDNPTEEFVNDENGYIADSYFATSDWSGLGVSQAGGCACLSFQEDPEDENNVYRGMIVTPTIDTTSPVKISFKVKALENGYINLETKSDDLEYMDGWQFTVNTEWHEVNLITLYSDINTRLYIYPNEDADVMLIDDIKVERLTVEGTPVILGETDVTERSFTINWQNDFDYYDIYSYATHTAKADETYSIFNADFSGITRQGTLDDPDFDDYDDLYPDLYDYSGNYGWTLQYPKYITGAICLDGEWASEGDYGAIVSPALDLSNNGGKVKFSITTKGFVGEGERYNVQLLSLINGVWYRQFAKGFDVTEDWTTNEIELTGGSDYSVIQIIYGGENLLAIKDISVSQDFKAGESITVPLAIAESIFVLGDDDDDDDWDEWDEWDEYSLSRGEDDEVTAAAVTINAPDKFVGDEFSYRVRGNRIVYFEPDVFEGWAYSKGVTGNWSDLRTVSTQTGVANIASNSNIKVYKSADAITVINPDKTQINVFNTAGVQVGRSNAEVATFNLPAGIYIVKVANKVVKIAK